MVGKNNFNKMQFKTGKEIIDFLMENPYTVEMADSIMLDFIGGEPLLEMELIDEICDYFILKMYAENHKWFPNYIFTFSTNGLLYGKPVVRDFVSKHGEHCSFSFSIDGTKEKHDLTRVKVDGSGSYDEVIKNLPLFMEENYNPATKSTFASDDLPYLKDSIIHLWDLGFKDVESNLVYEDVWKKGDPEIFEQQLKDLADYMFQSGRYNTHSVAYFSSTRGLPVGKADLDVNRCGAGYKTLAFDYQGDIYPCIRFLEMCADNKAKRVIGNIKDGVDYAKLRPMAAATWRSQSPDKCNVCDCGTDCGWCLAHNLSESEDESIFDRCTFICEMHKANARANKYYWQMYEEVTGNTSQRTIEKLGKSDTKCLRYLHLITRNDAPTHCSYSNLSNDSQRMPKDILQKGLNFCHDQEVVPVFLGGIPTDVDMKKKIYFEIDSINASFKNPRTGISVINDNKEIKEENIVTPVVSYIITTESIQGLGERVNRLLQKARRLNLFISDIEKWTENNLHMYEQELTVICNGIVNMYSKGKYGCQVNVLTDRLYASDKCDNDCGSGVSSISLAPNGKFYVCPAFYFNAPDKPIGDLATGVKLTDRQKYTREKAAMCVKCKSSVCNRCLYSNKQICGEYNVPADIQCKINYAETNMSKKLYDDLEQILPEGFYINRGLQNLEYIDYVAAEIYKDERAEANRWMY